MGPWRVTLENPHDGKMYGFADLKELFDFLIKETGDKRVSFIDESHRQ